MFLMINIKEKHTCDIFYHSNCSNVCKISKYQTNYDTIRYNYTVSQKKFPPFAKS